MADTEMPDADAIEEQRLQYAPGQVTAEELDSKYPNRPINTRKTLPFHQLFTTLFNPLNDARTKPGSAPIASRRKVGPHGQTKMTPHEARRNIIERFIDNWRKEVGNDVYPALRLIVPEKDRDRAMYGLKEKAIAKLLVRTMKIDAKSEDADKMLNWKLPGHKWSNASAGDFAGRCFEVISKRPLRTTIGNMSIAEVNADLDRLSLASKEEDQLPIFKRFYQRMNPEELMWLIRIILRQMKIGATEKTIFDIWHPDADALYNVSSNLRRVCWELWDPETRLLGEDTGVALMQCFQPQLAAFQMKSFDQMVKKMKGTEDDDSFWIEEKLDGERMQLHMVEDDSVLGGKRFKFWSRKAKDYTYLYGSSFDPDEECALTRFIKDAFGDNVRNIILDGEMITWDMELDKIVGFGTLKTAALSEQKNRFSSSTGQRPLYRVFDCLYLNDRPITQFTLRDRRRALEASLTPVHRRIEVHPYAEAHSPEDIDPALRKVVEAASEGLVLKNPRSAYRLNDRNDDWIKVKPEYMTEFGEALDCIVIGGYYGSGHRGGGLSSFMCGLRVDQEQIDRGADPMKCYSFFKVGGGFTKDDYNKIKHLTDGKWIDWDARNPPTDFIELGGHAENKQYERPDVWIKPNDSVVIAVKAASVGASDQFRLGMTLRFPRYKRLRPDKDWKSALSIKEFTTLQRNVQQEHQEKEKEFEVDQRRKKAKTTKKTLIISGSDTVRMPYGGPETKIFEGLSFYIMTEALKPQKTSKAELEQMVKNNGGKIVQKETAAKDLVIIADRNLVKVTVLEKHGKYNLIRPIWIFDCIKQAEIDSGRASLLLPFEPNRHMLFLKPDEQFQVEENVDEYGDSYARDITVDELKQLFSNMPTKFEETAFNPERFLDQSEDHDLNITTLPGYLFRGLTVYFDKPSQRNGGAVQSPKDLTLDLAAYSIRAGAGKISEALSDKEITHVVIGNDTSRLAQIMEAIAQRARLPRVVNVEWVQVSWAERTLVDEERFGVL
ncbi:ATP-dependent DNA ligase [Lophium mytilinum]|uniref:DNA ligase n=1 Tax=Lophium mytilinum TaxID=390894 RepID=A0A6A6RBF9_9PEZI|nr:ATP-dependent DNA ligase [Lophium mytilinum]